MKWDKASDDLKTIKKWQAGAELCQAQVNLEVVVEVGVELGSSKTKKVLWRIDNDKRLCYHCLGENLIAKGDIAPHL